MNSQESELEQRIETIFDEADDLMINKKNYKDAVINLFLTYPNKNNLIFRLNYTKIYLI
jgi:hypothetical protein